MFPSEYEINERRKNLIQQADQQRMARMVMQSSSLAQKAGQNLLKLGARLAREPQDTCYTVKTGGQVVTVCPA